MHQELPGPIQVQLASCAHERNKRKEVTIMEYETPEVKTTMPAINAIQAGKPNGDSLDNSKEIVAAYQDWEE